MKRLTTDNPQNNVETMLNYAYAKDGKVYLRYGDCEEEVELFDYLSRVTKSELHCQCCNDIAEDCMECDCIASVLFIVATQAAELRARLKRYEDAPIPDSVPVVHGHWIEEDGVQICSNCGEEHEWVDYRAPFCDQCGAMMDEEAADGNT